MTNTRGVGGWKSCLPPFDVGGANGNVNVATINKTPFISALAGQAYLSC